MTTNTNGAGESMERAMTDPYNALRNALDAGPTPGPRRWEFNRQHKTVSLVGGRPHFDKTLMSFARWGLDGAAPEFNAEIKGDRFNVMRRVCDMPEWLAPYQGREHHSDWCMNVVHPDAMLIAAADAPTLTALLAERDALAAEVQALRDRAERAEAACRWDEDARAQREADGRGGRAAKSKHFRWTRETFKQAYRELRLYDGYGFMHHAEPPLVTRLKSMWIQLKAKDPLEMPLKYRYESHLGMDIPF